MPPKGWCRAGMPTEQNSSLSPQQGDISRGERREDPAPAQRVPVTVRAVACTRERQNYAYSTHLRRSPTVTAVAGHRA